MGGKVYADYNPNDLYVFAGAKRPTASSLADVIAAGKRDHRRWRDDALQPRPRARAPGDPGARREDRSRPARRQAAARRTGHARRLGHHRRHVEGADHAAAANGCERPRGRSRRTGSASRSSRIGEGPCEGDSGGPALAASGAVIGVLSRGGNGSEDGGASACIGATSVYTEVAAFKELVLSAYARAGQAPWLEDQASPTEAQAAQPSAPAPDSGGCATAGGSGGAGGRWAIPVAFALIWYRRSRRLCPGPAREKFPSAPDARHIEGRERFVRRGSWLGSSSRRRCRPRRAGRGPRRRPPVRP